MKCKMVSREKKECCYWSGFPKNITHLEGVEQFLKAEEKIANLGMLHHELYILAANLVLFYACQS